MKHAWQDTTPSGVENWGAPRQRMCSNCGKVQKLNIEHAWMRVVSRRWEPLVGRCRAVDGSKDRKTDE